MNWLGAKAPLQKNVILNKLGYCPPQKPGAVEGSLTICSRDIERANSESSFDGLLMNLPGKDGFHLRERLRS
jgi:hypothetical protein